jgi:hypothetical protein
VRRLLVSLVWIALAMFTAAACQQGQPGSAQGLTSCAQVFADGGPTPTQGVTCAVANGLEIVSLNTVSCDDGTTLAYSIYGWGTVGKTWTYHDRHSGKDDTGLGKVLAVCEPGLYGGYLQTSAAPS